MQSIPALTLRMCCPSNGIQHYSNVLVSSRQNILAHSRKDSTTVTYAGKWKRFSIWTLQIHSPPINSIRVNLAASSVHHPPIHGHTVISHPTLTRFLMGLIYVFPPVRDPSQSWDLNIMLTSLMGLPFKPPATCSLYLCLRRLPFQ